MKNILFIIIVLMNGLVVFGQGNCVHLDGSNDYAITASNSVLQNASFSITWWAKRDASNRSGIAFSQGTSSTNQGLHVGHHSSNSNGMRMGFWSNDLDAPSSYNDTEWNFWAFTFDASNNNRRIYNNGVEIVSDVASSDFQGSGGMYIGKSFSSAAGSPHNGMLEELSIWSSVLSIGDIRNQMHKVLTGSETNLTSYYSFDQGTAGGSNTGITEFTDATGTYNATIQELARTGSTSNFVSSEAPIGATSVNSSLAFQSGTINLSNIEITTTDGFDNTQDVYAAEFTSAPATTGGLGGTIMGNRYWIINAFENAGGGGTFSLNLTFTFPNGVLTAGDTDLILYKRGSTSDGYWLPTGTLGTVTSTTAQFTGITSLSQFVILKPSPPASAPNITDGEYFFGTDPGYGSGTALTITDGTSIDENYSIDISGLSTGFHNLHIRVKDANNNWSETNVYSFFKGSIVSSAPNVTAAEYYFNNDPGYGSGTSLSVSSGTSINENFMIDISGLSEGFHNLHIRVKDANNNWSETNVHSFFKGSIVSGSPNMTAAEYYFDNDPGYGSGTSLSVSNGTAINENFTIDISGLAEGFHNLHVRVKDANNNWSETNVYSFYRGSIPSSAPNITAGEYFIDTDPGFGNGTALSFTASSSIDEDFTINISGLSEGTHYLYVRLKDANDNWTLVYVESFEKQTALPVNLLSFEAMLHLKDQVKLKWSSTHEIENDFFAIERRKITNEWEEIGRRDVQNIPNAVKHYEFIDITPFIGKNYYRLRQVDKNGAFTYSQIESIEVNSNEKADFKVSPNPFKQGPLQLDFINFEETPNKVMLYNLKGEMLLSFPLQENNTTIELNIPNKLSAGAYILTFRIKDRIYSKKIISSY